MGGDSRALDSALSRSDLVAVLDATRACAGADDLAQFAERIVAEVPNLVPCDHAAYNEVDCMAGTSWGRVNPPDVLRPEWHEILARFGQENPLIPHGMRQPEDVPWSWSEMTTLSELRRSNLYNLMYRYLDVVDQLAGIVSGSERSVAGVVAARSRPGFSERDRAVLDLFRAQLAPMRRHLEASDRLRAFTGGQNIGMISLDRSGAARWLTGDPAWLADLGLSTTPAPMSPLRVWLEDQRTRTGSRAATARFGTPHGTVWARFVRGSFEDVLVVGDAGDDPMVGAGWHVRLLGGFSLRGPGGPVRLEGRPAGVVKLLAVAGGPVPVDEMVERLWPDVTSEIGRRRLRGVLHRLPRVPDTLVVRRGDALAFASGVTIDALEFETAAKRAVSAARRRDGNAQALGEAAMARYQADLLPEDRYADWPSARREQLRRRRLELLDTLASYAESVGEPERAVALLNDAITCDPLDDVRQLRLAGLYAATGRRGAALAVLQRARSTAAELGVAPSPAWETLRASLRS